LYLSLSRMYFNNNAAGATASNSKRSRSAIFYLSKLPLRVRLISWLVKSV
jgi:hypothetical protein